MNSILITGGAGFIGCNTAATFIKKGWKVSIVDNLSRSGTERNLEWLKSQGDFDFYRFDIRVENQLEDIFKKKKFDFVLHLAAQVAVTSSVLNPYEDFEINAMGTLRVLEGIRKFNPEAFFLYASTNKVYGKLDGLGTVERNGRYGYTDLPGGVDENMPLDFHSPYGCSKGAADQYTIDYSRIYGLRTAAFRQSCIYGTRQFGVEDQGWIAWFTIAAILQKPLSIFGDGKQVRDALFVEDLVSAYEMAYKHREQISGKAFNIGGGPQHTLSLLELVSMLETKLSKKLNIDFGDWRPGDQKVFICNHSLFSHMTGWAPKVSVDRGVENLISWVIDNKQLLQSVLK